MLKALRVSTCDKTKTSMTLETNDVLAPILFD